jgi:ATP-binding cassette, subfamily B, bacterial
MSMPGHGMGMGGGGAQYGSVMRSMRRDESVIQQQVTKGTTRRMIQFARPYRKILTWFLVFVIIDAVVGVINPLLFRSIINDGIIKHNKDLIIVLSLVAAGVAVADTGLSIAIRWVSAKV